MFLCLIAAGLTFSDYSMFRAAHDDADRLEAYESQCWICAFKRQAAAEANSVRVIAAGREELRRRNALSADEEKLFREAQADIGQLESYLSSCEICAFSNLAKAQVTRLKQQAADSQAAVSLHATEVAKDEESYPEAHGDIVRLMAYLGSCFRCGFRSNAEIELNELRQKADIAEQARIADLQTQGQLTPPLPQVNVTPREVTWRIINNSGLVIAVQFFSQNQFGHAWPGSNMSWPMATGQTSDYKLTCETGEKICFGISAPFRAKSWGVGGSGTQGCDACCYTCDGALHAVDLAPLAELTNE